jgi:adenosylcobinamide kinase/adenosylcobinamide-phosphate guanylyltransferase
LPGLLVLVSNEVGQGVVPEGAMARAFIDHAGRLHQRIAELAGAVVFMTAGLPHRLK